MSNWKTDHPRNQGPNRRINEDAFSALSGVPGAANGELALQARVTNGPAAHVDGAIVVFNDDIVLDGFTSDAAGNYTCTVAGTYFLHAQVSTALDGVTAAWGDIHGVDILKGAVVVLRQWSNTLATANYVSVGGAIPLAVGDVIKVNAKTTAGNIAIQGSVNDFWTSLVAIRVL